MKKNNSIRLALAAASCALLIEQPIQAAETDAWIVNFGTLFYQEKERVSIIEPMMTATHNYNDEDFVSFRLVNDTMSGASPIGASVSGKQQRIPTHSLSSASGSGGPTEITISPNATPLNNFSDQRNSLGADWQKAYSRTFRSILGVNFSSENDYSSFGGSTTFQKDTADKLTTFTLGLSFSSDTIKPIGGAPQGLSILTETPINFEGEDDEGDERGDSEAEGEHKQLTDFLFGITQIVHRRVLTQLNYSIGSSSGYLTDPYKVVSTVDSTGTTLEGAYRTEKRPDNRLRQAIYWKTVIHLPSDVINLSYRYYRDDWSIQAHTVEAKYRMNLGNFYLMPNARYYTQTGANFFTHSLLFNPDNNTLPEFASADLRLAPMQSTTAGLKLGYSFSRNSEISFRAESMRQWGNSHPAEAVGAQKQVDLFPKLEVMMYTFEFSFEF